MSRIFIASVLAALVCSSPTLALAQGSEEERAERAQEAFDRGAAFYMEGNYGRALVEFKKANRAVPNPLFVLNMALANGRLGNYAQAIEEVDSARASGALDPRALALAQGASRAWRANLYAVEVAEARADRLAAIARDVPDPDPSLTPPPEAPAASTLGTLGVVSLSLAAAGGVGTAIHYFAVFGPAKQALDDSAGSTPSEIQQRLDDATTQQTIGQVLLFSSVGLGVLGGVFIALDAANSPESARISPLIGPDVAGARLDFTF